MSDNSEEEVILTCSFCGVEKGPDVPLIAGSNGHICEECVRLAHQVVSSWGSRQRKVEHRQELKSPRAIKSFLDSYVIGQDEAKQTLSVAIYNHYLRLFNHDKGQTLRSGEDAVELEKSNVLLVGPSGTGKTLLVKTLARIIGVPFVIGDATSLTQAGYVGEDVDTLLKRLLEAAEGDVQQAQWGIVYIDEIDKLARAGGGGSAVRDVSGEGVQQALLKMIEGTEVRFARSGKRDHGDEVTLNTTNILFVVGGAFPGLTELIGSRLQPHNKGIGFSAVLEKDSSFSNDQLLGAMHPEDLHKFGLIPEFIGRLPIVTFLNELDVDGLLRILKEPRNALVKQYQQLFAFQDVKLGFTDEALGYIAQQALDHGTGARGLRSILEMVLRPTMYELPRDGLEQVVVELVKEDGRHGKTGESRPVLKVREVFRDAEASADPVTPEQQGADHDKDLTRSDAPAGSGRTPGQETQKSAGAV